LTERTRGTANEIRRFGVLFAVLCTAAGVYARYAGSPRWGWWLVGGAFFLLTGIVARPVLRPLYLGWMRLASLLAWVNTRFLLGVVFLFVITPIGLVLRLFGKELLDERIERGATSYWKIRERMPFDRSRYERLF
jgi:hypothetical protein